MDAQSSIESRAPGGWTRRRWLQVAGGLAGLGAGPRVWSRAAEARSFQGGEGPEEFPHPVCANPPVGGPIRGGAPGPEMGEPKILFDEGKLWRPRGRQLVVQFLQRGPRGSWVETVRDRVREFCPDWCDYANLSFRFIDDNEDATADIVVNLVEEATAPIGTFDSQIGTDSQKYRTPQSMNLVFDPDWAHYPDQAAVLREFRRLVHHEFGHALGFIHEHQRFDSPIEWNEAELRKYAATWGWVRTDKVDPVRDQIIEPYKAKGTLSGTVFDKDSVMIYAFRQGVGRYKPDQEHPKGRPFESHWNADLSPMDRVAATTAYPMVVQNPDAAPIRVGEGAVRGRIAERGQVIRYYIHAEACQPLKVTVSEMPALVAWLRNSPPIPGVPGNVLAAGVTPHGKNVVTLELTPPVKEAPGEEPTRDVYYLEVRHRKPVAGLGQFTVRVDRVEKRNGG